MIVVGLILLVLGFLFGSSVLIWLGAALAIVGALLALAGSAGHPVGRRHYW